MGVYLSNLVSDLYRWLYVCALLLFLPFQRISLQVSSSIRPQIIEQHSVAMNLLASKNVSVHLLTCFDKSYIY